MTKDVTTISEEGFSATNEIREFETTIDANGEEAPDTLEALLAAYGSCYVPALRVGGQQRGVDDLGKIEIDMTGELNDDDKLDSISFEIHVEADVDDDTGEQVLERAFELCKVHDALKGELHAEASITGDAF
ncbi:OsmC family protein [Natronorubrum bangense]|uniref:OsmC family protein n=2 Tax=Natronorubrum bangense TaxID=61858 RepID=L9WR19_9EURY|nr:OsmC family protein [Natronorubrum bangense]ELY51929.1 OsmC family protein [Natronorubrum bangense JCM 10635]QCC54846.1 OsmC family peroxiredoxin [Natronorubrum bangense]